MNPTEDNLDAGYNILDVTAAESKGWNEGWDCGYRNATGHFERQIDTLKSGKNYYEQQYYQANDLKVNLEGKVGDVEAYATRIMLDPCTSDEVALQMVMLLRIVNAE